MAASSGPVPPRRGTLLRLLKPHRVAERAVGRRHVVEFEGELDLASVADLERALARAAEGSPRELWVDLTSTVFMDCAGVHCLLRAQAVSAQHRRRFAVVCGGGPVRRVLALTGADRQLDLYASRAAAHRAA